jgi:hypothetical protein
MYETAWLLPSTLHLEAARPGAAAHMSLHLNQQCQRATKIDAAPFPFFQGRPLRLNFGDRRCLSEEHRVGEVASMRGPPDRQRENETFCRFRDS